MYCTCNVYYETSYIYIYMTSYSHKWKLTFMGKNESGKRYMYVLKKIHYGTKNQPKYRVLIKSLILIVKLCKPMQWGSLSVLHLPWHGTSVFQVISVIFTPAVEPCHHFFKWFKYVETGTRTPISRMHKSMPYKIFYIQLELGPLLWISSHRESKTLRYFHMFSIF